MKTCNNQVVTQIMLATQQWLIPSVYDEGARMQGFCHVIFSFLESFSKFINTLNFTILESDKFLDVEVIVSPAVCVL